MVPLIYNESTSSNSAKVKRLKTPWNIHRKIIETAEQNINAKAHCCLGDTPTLRNLEKNIEKLGWSQDDANIVNYTLMSKDDDVHECL